VLEGRYKMKAGDAMFEGGPGDVFWVPANTPLVYMGDKATIFYAVWPVDWRKRHGMA
jgi:ethanolamine utilization protein EutQ